MQILSIEPDTLLLLKHRNSWKEYLLLFVWLFYWQFESRKKISLFESPVWASNWAHQRLPLKKDTHRAGEHTLIWNWEFHSEIVLIKTRCCVLYLWTQLWSLNAQKSVLEIFFFHWLSNYISMKKLNVSQIKIIKKCL